MDFAGISVGLGSSSGSATSLFRLVFFGGYHSPKGAETSWRVAAGLGVQDETSIQVTDTGGGGSAAWGTRFVVRGAYHRPLFSDSARFRGEQELATLSMSRLDVGTSSSMTDVFGVESTTRLHADIRALEFFGFVPDAFIGLDVVAVNSATAFVPLLGVGVIR